jgi:hypothetical protein
MHVYACYMHVLFQIYLYIIKKDRVILANLKCGEFLAGVLRDF